MKQKIFCTLWVLFFVLFGYMWGYIYSELQHVPPHFHANFALYINGERLDFSGDEFMEDIAGCSITGEIWARDRVHLHENNPDTIHVHHSGVTWWHFFANNRFTFWENFISSDSWEVYINSWERKLYFILNGKEISNPFNTLISSEDRLLIIYGQEDETARQWLYDTVSKNAPEYNAKYDPGSCGGTNENALMVIVREMFTSHSHK